MKKLYQSVISLSISLILVLPVHAGDTVADPNNEDKRELTEEEVEGHIGRMGESIYQVPEGYEFSEAEVKLWFSNHLENITQPTRLLYEFSKSGSYEEGFEDSVHLEIRELNEDGTKNAWMQFFTGERKQYIDPANVQNITGNPVLGIFMTGDIYEMDRYTGGSWRYFLNSIKTSIHEDAVIEPVEFEFSGTTYSGNKITFSPYVNDPKRRQFEKFARKSYEMIFSEDIPGQLYQIRTVIPPQDGEAEPLVEEVLTLAEIASS